MGLKAKLKKIAGLKTKSIMVEDWGFEVELREPTAGEAVKYSKKAAKAAKDPNDEGSAAWEMLSLCIFEGGERVFANAAEAEAAMGDKGFAAIKCLSEACQKLLGVDVDAALKNLLETQVEDSSSA